MSDTRKTLDRQRNPSEDIHYSIDHPHSSKVRDDDVSPPEKTRKIII